MYDGHKYISLSHTYYDEYISRHILNMYRLLSLHRVPVGVLEISGVPMKAGMFRRAIKLYTVQTKMAHHKDLLNPYSDCIEGACYSNPLTAYSQLWKYCSWWAIAPFCCHHSTLLLRYILWLLFLSPCCICLL